MRRSSVVAVLALAGCGSAQTMNPSFAVSSREARALLREMRGDPKPLERPVVVISGLLDPGFAASTIAGAVRRITTDDDLVVTVSFMQLNRGTFEKCRAHLVDVVERSFGGTADGETVEVDVIGFSMGGLVARHAARADCEPRLRINRLFTISAPHRGARLAELPTLDDRTIDMRTGSEFLAALDEALADAEYPLYAYTRLGDFVVGAENAAPPGRTPWWVPTPPFELAHLGAPGDPRILADIVRRLRGETPLAQTPPAPFAPGREEVAQTSRFGGSAPQPDT